MCSEREEFPPKWGTSCPGLCYGPRDISEDDPSSKKPGPRERNIQCRFAPDGEQYAGADQGQSHHSGLITGFVGGAHNWEDSSDVSVGSIQAVCAPYSSTSYTDNWRFLSTKGAVVPGDSLRGRRHWQQLRHYLRDSYEMRYSKDERRSEPRPSSMKMCPPHYAVSGVYLTLKQEAPHEPIVTVGVAGLYCTKVSDSLERVKIVGNDELVVFTNDKGSSHTLNGRGFSLDQWIGSPEAAGTFEGVVDSWSHRCAAGHVAKGFKTIHDSSGRLTHFELRCHKAPQSPN